MAGDVGRPPGPQPDADDPIPRGLGRRRGAGARRHPRRRRRGGLRTGPVRQRRGRCRLRGGARSRSRAEAGHARSPSDGGAAPVGVDRVAGVHRAGARPARGSRARAWGRRWGRRLCRPDREGPRRPSIGDGLRRGPRSCALAGRRRGDRLQGRPVRGDRERRRRRARPDRWEDRRGIARRAERRWQADQPRRPADGDPAGGAQPEHSFLHRRAGALATRRARPARGRGQATRRGGRGVPPRRLRRRLQESARTARRRGKVVVQVTATEPKPIEQAVGATAE